MQFVDGFGVFMSALCQTRRIWQAKFAPQVQSVMDCLACDELAARNPSDPWLIPKSWLSKTEKLLNNLD
jgi:hypothetical protein